jgi:hypothetical protein
VEAGAAGFGEALAALGVALDGGADEGSKEGLR